MAWAAIAVATIAVLVSTTVPVDLWAVRYAVVLWPALAAVIGLMAAGTRVRATAATVVAIVLIVVNVGAVGALLHQRGPTTGVPGHGRRRDAPAGPGGSHRLFGLLAQHAGHVECRAGSVSVYPVLEGSACGGTDPGKLCGFRWYSLDDWYSGHPGPSAVIVDPGRSVSLPPSRAYGTPSDVLRTPGYPMTVYVFAHDLAPAPGGYPAD